MSEQEGCDRQSWVAFWGEKPSRFGGENPREMDTYFDFFLCFLVVARSFLETNLGAPEEVILPSKIVRVKREFLQILGFFVKKRVLGYYTGFEYFFKKHDFWVFWVVARSFLGRAWWM